MEGSVVVLEAHILPVSLHHQYLDNRCGYSIIYV